MRPGNGRQFVEPAHFLNMDQFDGVSFVGQEEFKEFNILASIFVLS